MSTHPPCRAWAEKLALRSEDLSEVEQEALAVHVETCPHCAAAQVDYHLIDARLRALPPPSVKPLPRLSLQPLSTREAGKEKPFAARSNNPARSSGEQPSTRRHRFTPANKVVSTIFVASLVAAVLLVFGLRLLGPSGDATAGTTLYTYHGHSNVIAAVAWSPDGRYIASGSWDNTVKIWNAKTGALLFSYSHLKAVNALAWSPNSQYLASASEDNTVQVWQVQKNQNQPFFTYTGHKEPVNALSWSPDGRFIASAGGDGTIQVWDWQARSNQSIITYQYGEVVYTLSWSPNGRYIAAAGGDRWVQVWDWQTGQQKPLYYREHDDVVQTLTWSPLDHGNLYIASGDRSGQIRVWKVLAQGAQTQAQTLYVYNGHQGAVNTLAWSPNGHYIASGGGGQTIQIWNWEAKSNKPVLIYQGHHDTIDALAWSPDSRDIVSGSDDQTVQMWVAVSSG